MLLYRDGALAQLGARIAGSDEVTGSSPVHSTIQISGYRAGRHGIFFIINFAFPFSFV